MSERIFFIHIPEILNFNTILAFSCLMFLKMLGIIKVDTLDTDYNFMELFMKNIFERIRKNSYCITAFFLILSTLLAFLFSHIIPGDSPNISLIYILSLVMIARYTQGYAFGIFSSVFCVISVNYFFTYPYFKLNFTLAGYPLTFLGMLTISIITSATTTQLKHQAYIIAEREKSLMEADKEKMKANLLRAISHDLRTPLTGIIGAASSYTENEEFLSSEEKRDLVCQISDDANWLLNMVENLLSVTRIQNSTAKLSTSLEVVEEVVSEAILRLRKRIPDAQIRVSIPEAFLMVPMDPLLIEQVIINLLENAIVHSESSKPIDLIVTDTPSQVTFHVIDYGKGLSPERIPSLFDGQSSSTSSDSHRGMGIGLSICKTIIQAHNGEITAFNHDNGAEFCFSLPKEVTAYER